MGDRKWLGLVALAVVVLASLSPSQARADDRDYAGKAATLVEPYLESGLFSGTILVARDGKPVFRQAYGLANREWDAPNTLDTHFRIGSLTKQFTSAAILQLAERGKLSLDDRIRKFVPSAPAAWDRVTLRDLLGHTSGIINYTALPDYYAKLSRIETSPLDIVHMVANEPLLFEPGARVEYSNTGYVLLGMAIEAASGQPYARYLAANILDPLGLKQTSYDDVTLVLPHRATGYRFGQQHWRNAPPMSSSIAYAAGGLYSTVDDLLAWDQALFSGRVISQRSLADMTDDHGRGYALGWYVGKAHDRRLISHGGAVSGFLSILDHFPDDHLTVIVLANNENAPVQKIARELSALAFGTLDPLDSIVLEDLILDRYAGTYQLGPRYFLSVTREFGRLVARGTGEPAYAFLPESDRTFLSPVIDARITFDTEPDGRPNGLVLHQLGRDRLGRRVSPEEAARVLAQPKPEHREIALERARLSRFVGHYALAPDVELDVALDDDGLTIQATAEPIYDLLPESRTSFFLKAMDAQVSFDLDAEGRVTGLVLHRHGLDTSAQRVAGDQAFMRPNADFKLR